MPKPQRHSGPRSTSIKLVFLACIIFLSFVFSSFNSIRVRTITFTASDGLEITAEEYFIGPEKPYVLLFHEHGSSRGEFSTIARRLCKLDYNCLAVDLRNGGNYKYISNETTKRLRGSNLDTGLKGIEVDLLAYFRYDREKS